jgi:hypothetical protein
LDSSHWTAQTAQLVRKGVAIAIAGASAVVGVVSLALLRAALKDAAKVLEIVLFVLTTAGIFVPLGLLALAGSIRLFTGRVAYLDSLARDHIRKEAERKTLYSFWAAADDLADVAIDPAPAKGLAARAAALLSFRHGPTGKWKLELVSTKDTTAAVESFRKLLPGDEIAINVRLKN